MKPKFISFLILAALLISTCQKPERDNPWDDKSTLKPEDWAPKNLAVEDLSITSKKLTWSYSGVDNFEGFKLDRKEGEAQWQLNYLILPKDARQVADTMIIPSSSLLYTYRLFTYAGENASGNITISASSADIPPPSNVAVTKMTDASYKISWEDNITGEQGFKIDRKRGNDDWEMAYGSVPANHTEFIDENVFPTKCSISLDYRVYAWYKEHESAKVTVNTNISLTPPSNLQIIFNAQTAVTLNWQYTGNSHQGFKIDRMEHEGNYWQEAFVTLDKTKTSYTDTDVNLANNSYTYRVYAYKNTFISAKIEIFVSKPIVTSTSISNITANTATGGGNVTADGGFAVTARGVVWSTSQNPTIGSNMGMTNNGSGAGSFTSNLTGLSPGTAYFVRAYATNSAGTGYGNQINFTTTIPIGIPYQGGIVAYILQPGDPGYIEGEVHGLIAAPSDQSTGTQWGCYNTFIGGTSTALGTGAANTAAIVAGCSTAGIAARICNNLELNGYSDWYLPSLDELNKLYINRAAIGGFASSLYWSSSEYSSYVAWVQFFSLGYQHSLNKGYSYRVRAVRAF